MSLNSLKKQRLSQIRALRWLLWLAITGFATLQLIQAFVLSQSHFKYQRELMSSVSQSILADLTQTINSQRLQMALFLSANHQTINQQLQNPKSITESDYRAMLSKIKTQLPDSRLYTQITSDGENLLKHITGEFLADCKLEISDTLISGEQTSLFLHRSKTSIHYDLIIPQDKNELSLGYFFVAFNIDFIAQLLNKYQLPFQQLFLLRNDQTGMIEISTESNSDSNEVEYISAKNLDDFEYSIDIPDTRWRFAIRLNPDTKNQLFYAALVQSFITWAVITLLLLIAYRLIKRHQDSSYQSQVQLNQSKQQAETLINSVNEAVFSIDNDLQITFANYRARILLSKSTTEIIGANFSKICRLYNAPEHLQQSFSDIIQAYRENRMSEYSSLTLKIDHSMEIPVAVKLAPIYAEEASTVGYAITIEDLSSAFDLSRKLVFHESRDKLTGLFNRRMLEQHLQQRLQELKQNPEQSNSALILIDLDKFKLLNTSHSFEAGDEYLKRFSVRLRKTIHPNDFLSRLSSDEFIVSIKNISEAHLAQLCNSIKLMIRNFELTWEKEIISTTACLGVVRLDNKFININAVLSAADHACRIAKTKGSNITQFYFSEDPEIKQRAREITQIVDLRKALDNNNFMLYRQAIIPTNDKLSFPQKYELLIRMKGINGSIVPPAHFIDIAEKYGFMLKIDRWVIYNAFQQLSKLGTKDTASYNINISSKTVGDPSSILFVENLFEQFSIQPERINFEITETSAISYLNNALAFMHAMKLKGCSFSLDDFGTGLASFDYLRKLPIDYLKIDGIFVKDIQTNPNDFAFIEAIHKISHQMNIKTVAEYVENENIFNILREIGVDYVQGYHFHKPEHWLDN